MDSVFRTGNGTPIARQRPRRRMTVSDRRSRRQVPLAETPAAQAPGSRPARNWIYHMATRPRCPRRCGVRGDRWPGCGSPAAWRRPVRISAPGPGRAPRRRAIRQAGAADGAGDVAGAAGQGRAKPRRPCMSIAGRPGGQRASRLVLCRAVTGRSPVRLAARVRQRVVAAQRQRSGRGRCRAGAQLGGLVAGQSPDDCYDLPRPMRWWRVAARWRRRCNWPPNSLRTGPTDTLNPGAAEQTRRPGTHYRGHTDGKFQHESAAY